MLLILYAFLFSVSLVLGYAMNKYDGAFLMENGLIKLCWIAVLTVLLSLLLGLAKKIVRRYGFSLQPNRKERRLFLFVWGSLLVVYCAYLLVFYPGFLSHDAVGNQFAQIFGDRPYDNHHPVLHTLFIRFSLFIGSIFSSRINTGVAVYSLLQMTALSGIFSYCVVFLYRRGVHKGLVLFAWGYFLLHPLHGFYSVTVYKDPLFGGFLLLYALLLLHIVDTLGECLSSFWFLCRMVLIILLICFTRNNGLYCVLGTAPFLLWKGFGARRNLAAVFVFCLLAVKLVQGPIFTLAQIPRESFAESLSVPLQQVGRVVSYDGNITKRQEAQIEEVLKMEYIKILYDEDIADPIKFSPEFHGELIKENPRRFFSLWFSVFCQNPVLYGEAYLKVTGGYWSVFHENWYLISYEQEGDKPLNSVRENVYGVHESSKLPFLYNGMYKYLDPAWLFSHLPWPISWLFSMGAMFWMILLLCIFSMERGRAEYLCFLPGFAVWATLMAASPGSDIGRYAYPLFVFFPVALALGLSRAKAGSGRQPYTMTQKI